jgi:hypothetical protein
VVCRWTKCTENRRKYKELRKIQLKLDVLSVASSVKRLSHLPLQLSPPVDFELGLQGMPNYISSTLGHVIRDVFNVIKD